MKITFIGGNMSLTSGHSRPAHLLARELIKKDIDVEIVMTSKHLVNYEPFMKRQKWEGLEHIPIKFFDYDEDGLEEQLKESHIIHFFEFETYFKIKKRFPFIKEKVKYFSLNSKLKRDISDLKNMGTLAFKELLSLTQIRNKLLPNFVYRRLFKDFQKIFTYCEYVQSWAEKIKLKNVYKIHMPINYDVIDYKELKDEEKLTYGFFGNILYMRGVGDLIKAFDHMDSNEDTLIIDGLPGRDFESLKKDMKKTNRKNITMDVKNYENLNQFFEKIDVMVLPFKGEQSAQPPLVVLEAMAAGIPVISSNNVSIPEMITHNKNGLLIKPGDIEDIAKAMKKIKSIKVRKKLTKYGYEYLTQTHDPELVGKEYLKIIKKDLK